MFEKSFKDMLAVDVSKYIKVRDGAEYLPWAACKQLLHDYGAEVVMFEPVPGFDGCTLRKSELEFKDKNGVVNRCYEVKVHIKVDNLEWDITYPVVNGNNPVKDNSMTQLRVHNAVRRAFVKGVAERTGLGFGLWLKIDDLPEEPVDDLSKHSLFKCKQRLEETITAKIKRVPFNVLCERIGRSEDEVRAMMKTYYLALAKLEKDISEVQV